MAEAVSPFEVFNRVPGLRQLALLAGLAAAIAGGIGLFLWARGDTYGLLNVGLSDRDASQVTEALTASGIPFRLEGGELQVPSARLQEARLKLAAQDLPAGQGLGLEMLNQDPGLGVSGFLENARYQHALETELSRTIASLRPVKAARVHLAIPRASAFAGSRQPASASVLVELHPGRSLEAGQVGAIAQLVAGSIPQLEVSRVSVVDQQGRLLSGGDGESGAHEAELQKTRNIEQNLTRRIEQLLLPLTGPGRLSVQVAADVDYSSTEEVQESYRPDPQALRSETRNEQISRDPAAVTRAGGVPGAASNQPAGSGGTVVPAAAPAAAAKTGVASEPISETRNSARNYELDRTIRHTRQPAGRIRRINVGVLVDRLMRPGTDGKLQPTALSAEELKQIESVVREVVGYSAERGDSVSVMNTAFYAAPAEKLPAEPLWQDPKVWDLGRSGLGLLVLVALALFVVRPTLRSLMQPAAALPAPAMAGEAVAVSVAAGPERGEGYEQKLQLARNLANQDPKRVAQVVRTWVGNADA